MAGKQVLSEMAGSPNHDHNEVKVDTNSSPVLVRNGTSAARSRKGMAAGIKHEARVRTLCGKGQGGTGAPGEGEGEGCKPARRDADALAVNHQGRARFRNGVRRQPSA